MTKRLVWILSGALGSGKPRWIVTLSLRFAPKRWSVRRLRPVFDEFTVSIGPRLTASPAHKRAAEFARERLASYGLENARLEPFHFGRGWTLEHLTIEMIEPRYFPLIGYADAWSPSTSGEIIASARVDRRQVAGGGRGDGRATKGRHRDDRSDHDQLHPQRSPAAERSGLCAGIGGLCDGRAR